MGSALPLWRPPIHVPTMESQIELGSRRPAPRWNQDGNREFRHTRACLQNPSRASRALVQNLLVLLVQNLIVPCSAEIARSCIDEFTRSYSAALIDWSRSTQKRATSRIVHGSGDVGSTGLPREPPTHRNSSELIFIFKIMACGGDVISSFNFEVIVHVKSSQ